MKRLFLIALAIWFMSSAQNAAADDYFSKVFQDMDIDYNAFIEYEEYEYYMTYPSREEFEKIDLTADGKVQLFEWVTFQQKLDPDVHEYRYRYEDRSGDRFYHRDRSWYRISGGFVYKLMGQEWKKLGRSHVYRPHYYSRHYYDSYWDPYYYHHLGHYDHYDRFGFGYHHGFGYGHGWRVWD